MEDDIIRKKLEIATNFICQLYRLDLITDAYIVGSVAEGTARKESDIDLNLVNPRVPELFTGKLRQKVDDPIVSNIIKSITDIIGAKFTKLNNFHELTYKNEIFDIFIFNEFNPGMGVISIPKSECNKIILNENSGDNMYLYRVKIPQGYIFEEVLYFMLKPGDYPFGKVEFVRELSKEEGDEYNKTIHLLEKISITETYISWNKYKITTPKGFTFEAILPSGLKPDTYPFGKVEIIRSVPEDEQKHEIFTILALWEEHLPIEKI